MPFSHDQFRHLMHDVFECCLVIQEAKGKDYSGTDDALRTLKRQGERLEITPMQAWGVLADKGWNANLTFAATGKPGSEPLIQRVCDTINYAVFLLALAEDAGIETGFERVSDLMVQGATVPTPDIGTLMNATAGAKYSHKYPGAPGHNPDDPGDCFTSNCEYGCGAWCGPSRSGAPDGIDPFGNCPKHPLCMPEHVHDFRGDPLRCTDPDCNALKKMSDRRPEQMRDEI